MKAFLGVYAVRLDLPWARSLKETRSVVRPVVERLRSRLRGSVARLDRGQGWETIGYSAISGDSSEVQELLRRAAECVGAGEGDYRVGPEQTYVSEVILDELGGFLP